MRIIYQVFCCWCPYWYHWHNTFFVLRMLLVILTYSDTIKILATLQTHSCCWQCSADVPYFGSCGNYLACLLGMEERYSSRAHDLAFTSANGVVRCKLALCTQFCLLATILSLCFHILPSEHCGNIQSGHSAVIVYWL